MQVQSIALAIFSLLASASPTNSRKTCVVESSGTNLTDDAPAIRAAFDSCGRNGMIVFSPTTYYVNSVLDIKGLEDVDIDVQGELLVSDTPRLPLDISLTSITVEHRHRVLAQRLNSIWLPEPKHCFHAWW
jgi:hypothetical protein